MKNPRHIHVLAICGYTTAGLAIMAKELGYLVTGADEDAYPPNSILLTRAGIAWHNFHAPKNLTEWGLPDLVVQGNQIRKGNPELAAAKRLKLKVISDSEFFYSLTEERRRIVVTGSHGKTTVSALIAWILAVAGRRPGFRLGTSVKNFQTAVRLGEGQEFIFEGDEYTTTCFDQRPKFFHFHPHVAIINNIEWDHPDVFKSPYDYRNLFKKYLTGQMPRSGLVVYNAEDEEVLKVVKNANCRTSSFGLEKGDLRAKGIKFSENRTGFVVYNRGRKVGFFATKLAGTHNVKNSLAAIAVALAAGVEVSKIRKALLTFRGTSRRFEFVGMAKGVTVIDDYAHHPTKARETIAAAKKRYPQSRILAVYVPHTYSRTEALFKDYLKAFRAADLLIVPDIEPARERHLSSLIHSKDLVTALSRGQKDIYYLPEQSQIIDFLLKKIRSGDVILCMSVRGFNNLARKLLSALKNK